MRKAPDQNIGRLTGKWAKASALFGYSYVGSAIATLRGSFLLYRGEAGCGRAEVMAG
ncbi:MAG: hypothetical protein HY694_12515 [Deltaproteobacteria bacterium]|nr:hypothetical protein [Deltaproteobacteria bacterium]